jgi:hypothetical protein
MSESPTRKIAKDIPDRFAEDELRRAFYCLAWAVGTGTAPGRSSIRADAFTDVTDALFPLQLTLGLQPKLRLMTFGPAVLLPKLIGALSHLAFSTIGARLHLGILPLLISCSIRETAAY